MFNGGKVSSWWVWGEIVVVAGSSIQCVFIRSRWIRGQSGGFPFLYRVDRFVGIRVWMISVCIFKFTFGGTGVGECQAVVRGLRKRL